MPEHYKLSLNKYEWRTLKTVGHRYSWSSTLLKYCVEGENKLTEEQAWSIKLAFQADSQGKHGMFPMLSPGSYLRTKLLDFYQGVK